MIINTNSIENFCYEKKCISKGKNINFGAGLISNKTIEQADEFIKKISQEEKEELVQQLPDAKKKVAVPIQNAIASTIASIKDGLSSNKPASKILSKTEDILEKNGAIEGKVNVQEIHTNEAEKVNQIKKIINARYPYYENTKLFSIYFEDKIKKMLKEKSPEEIQKMITEIAKETGCDEKTAGSVMASLSQFSSYSQLKGLQQKLQDMGVSLVHVPENCNININNAFHYIQDKKKQIDLGYNFNTSEVLFLDDTVLKHIENLAVTEPNTLAHLRINIQNNKIRLVNISGWNCNIDGKNVSQGIFGAQMDLKEATTAVIKEMQSSNQTQEEVLNERFIRRARKVFGNDVEITTIGNKIDSNAEDIAQALKPVYPSASVIKAVIDTIVEKQMPTTDYSIQEIIQARGVLAKYFDTMIKCESVETLNEALRSKYFEIQKFVEEKGKTMDDVVYVIPTQEKSFDLVTYQYMKTNGINPNKAVYFDGENNPPANLDNKVIVILDDIVGSGHSMLFQEFKYNDFLFYHAKDKNINVIFSPLSCLRSGFDTIVNEIIYSGRLTNDSLKAGKIVDFGKFSNSLSNEERNILMKIIGFGGFGDGNACTAMPYMLPDNNTLASGFLLQYCINNVKGNKSSEWYRNFHQLVSDKLLKVQAT